MALSKPVTPRNVAVFGWYHHQNEGDDRIQRCLTRWLDGHSLAFLPGGRPPPLEYLRTCDAALIGGGGLIQREGGLFERMAHWVKSAGIPVALVSVSIEKLTPPLRAELRSFLDVACFAWLRDAGSLEALGPHPHAFVAPDITWLHPHPVCEPGGDAVAVCLRKERGLDVAAWREALRSLGRPLLAWPFYFERGGDAGVARELIPDAAVPDEFSLAPVRRAAAVITGRFHGVLYALQTGRPVLAVSSRPKTRRFLAEHGLERWCVDEDEPRRLVDLWPEFEAAWPALRDRALELRERLQRATREAATRARERLWAAANALPPPSRRLKSRLRTLLGLR